VCAYLGTLFEGGSIRGQSLRPYVAAIVAQHRRLVLPDPIFHELVKLARRGFAAAEDRCCSGAPLRSAAYPAAAAEFCLNRALTATDIPALRFWAVVSVGFLLSARPASVLALSYDAIRVSATAVMLELPVFKYGESGFSPLESLFIPTAGANDSIRSLFLRLLESTPLSAAAAAIPWFNHRDLVAATDAGLQGVSARPPPGARYTPRSIRSVCITAAYAVGMPVEGIMCLSNHASAAVAMRPHLDPLVPPTPAARVLFQRFVPSQCSLPFPTALVSHHIGNPRTAELSTSLCLVSEIIL
jgi:hypothetical protein